MNGAGSGIPALEPLLGRENWHTWKFAMRTYLEVEDLWEAVEPTPDADGNLPAVDAAKNRKARGKIVLGLHPTLFVHVESAKTASEAWKLLEKTFEDSGLTRKWGLLHKLITTNLDSCGSMESYVTRMVSTANQLNGVGLKIGEEWLGMLLLAGLPETYRPMVMALENSGAAITGDVVKTKLLQEVQQPSVTMDPAFVSKAPRKSKQGGSENHSSKGPKCRCCGKFGHIARFCPSKESAKKSDKKGDAFCTVLSVAAMDEEEAWYFDSGSCRHLTRNESLLSDVHQADGKIFAANKGVMKVVAEGTVALHPTCSEGSPIDVNEVQLIPELAANLLSVSKIVDRGHTVIFRQQGCEVINPQGKRIATGHRSNGLFKLDQQPSRALACPSTKSIDLWHKRTGHLSIKGLKQLRNGLASGVDFVESEAGDCKVCAMGRQTRLPFSKEGTRATEVLELVHSDICGPMEEVSLGGSRYYLSFIDDKTRRIFVYFLRTKSAEEVLEAFKSFCTMAERQTGKKLKILRTDNGKEFKNHGFENLLRRLGICHQTTVDYTPEQNGMAERANRTIVERARCMLYEANLPKTFWAEATAAAVYVINRSPSTGIRMTPEEAWSGQKPDLSNLRIFGTTTMSHIPKQKRRKWDAKAEECILIGFDEESKAYRLYSKKTKKVFKSRDVTFIDEGKQAACQESESKVRDEANRRQPMMIRLDFGDCDLPDDNHEADAKQPEMERLEVNRPNPPEQDDDSTSDSSSEDDFDSADDSVTIPAALPSRPVSNPPESHEALRRSGRERFIPGKYKQYDIRCKGLPASTFSDGPSRTSDDVTGDETGEATSDLVNNPGSLQRSASPSCSNQRPVEDVQQGLMLCDRGRPPRGKYSHTDGEDSYTGSDFPQYISDDPATPQEALSRDDAELWKSAMQEEYDAQIRNGTWSLTDLPAGRKAIRCKWVYKTKLDADGRPVRHKARLVIKGFSQRKGVDYEETYSPVVRHSSLRYLFAMAARLDLDIDQMDAVTAFLQGELSEEIYMEQPAYFEDPRNKSKVCRLNKALYGLKQSSRVWNQKLDAALKKFGLASTDYDPCVYYKTAGNKVLFVAVYVDDVLIFSNCRRWRKQLKDFLSKEFLMKDIGPAKHVLGMRVTRSQGKITIDQEAYVESILERFKMSNSNPVATPLNPNDKLTKEMGPANEEEIERMKRVPYKEAVGCLMYLAQCTRPDICHAVNVLCRFNENPGEKHWNAVKHLLRYLRGTSKFRLTYRKDADPKITGYSDADWATSSEDRKSITGFVFVAQGAAISWCCKRQQTVALSTCEAEYMALSAAVQEALWWKRLRAMFESDEAIKIHCDNQSTIAVAKNGGYHARTKHIDIRHFFIRDAVERGDVNVGYIGTDKQIADCLTKPLAKPKIKAQRAAMGLHIQ